jgi:hypothetical protein
MGTYVITYNKKDVIMRNYLEAKSQIPTSNMVELAIEYYAKTGEYLYLGRVSLCDEHTDTAHRCIYLSKNSEAERILPVLREQKGGLKALIRELIINGTEIADSTDEITIQDYLLAQKKVYSLSSTGRMADATIVKETKKAIAAEKPSFTDSKDILPEKPVAEIRQEQEEELKSKEKKRKKERINFFDSFIQNPAAESEKREE